MRIYGRTFHRWFWVALLGGLAVGFSGCGGPEAGTDEAEKRHPEVKEARELVKQQELDAAAETLYGVLRKDPSIAYAHMQLGFVFQSKREPVKALYHFERYLEARPDTENAEVIREVVEDELKRLARGQGGGDPGAGSTGVETAELETRLRETRRQLARTRVELRQLQMKTGEEAGGEPPEWAEEKLFLLEEIERLRAVGTAANAPAPAGRDSEADSGEGARRYTVKAGDTLSGIAQKMYGRSSRWRVILEANREQIPASDQLSPGMTLVIPEASR